MPNPQYANVVQVTRTPWDISLHFLVVTMPVGNMPPGTIVNVMEHTRPVAVLTVPLEVGRKMIEVLQTATADGAIELVEQKVEQK